MQKSDPGRRPLPLAMPRDPLQRLVLVAMRRMAAHGIHDAHAAMLFLRTFGIHFRKPLILLRAFMVELAQASQRRISMAPCCAMRMTEDEGLLVGILAIAASDRVGTIRHLRFLTANGRIDHPLGTAAAFNDTLADLGRPLVI